MNEVLSVSLVTLKVTGVATLLAALLGIPAGALMGMLRFRGRGFIAILLYTGMGLPPVVVGLVVYLLLSRSGILGDLGWLFTERAMITAQTILAFPLVAGLTMASVEALEPDLRLQLRTLGATQRQELALTVFEARAGVVASVLAGFGAIISEVGAAMLVGGNIAGHTRILSTAVVLETRRGNFGLALMLGGLLLALAFTVNLLLLKFQTPIWRRR
jgi:tungstate transport system permease protein